MGPEALGYDNKGNLYIEGLGSGSQELVCELPFQSGKLQVDSFDQAINRGDGVMWDGKSVMLADVRSGSINLSLVKSSHKGVIKTVGTSTLTDQDCSSLLVLGPFVVGQKHRQLHQNSTPCACSVVLAALQSIEGGTSKCAVRLSGL